MSDSALECAIAIIGLTGRFPGARTIEELWQNLCAGKETITFFSNEELRQAGVDQSIIDDEHYIGARGYVDDIELFDASFFGYNPREAETADPQQRLFLECAYEVLEQAGYDVERAKERIGIYGGSSMSSYLLHTLFSTHNPYDALLVQIGNDKDFLASNISYRLNLRGPGVVVQTACSTSLVAVHLACQSLLSGECDLALAGGVSLDSRRKVGYFYYEGGISSLDGHCRAFDEEAQGIVGGDGVGIVLLKRYQDAIQDGDTIQAIIRGSAINNDGGLRVGYTAPGVEGQKQVITDALTTAGVDPESISYIEAHGTGTLLGDTVEIAALKAIFGSLPEKRHALGSIKANIGHLDAAAGVAGLIKTILMLKHKSIPPQINFHRPHSHHHLEDSPFFINTTQQLWRCDHLPRRAGVSSFGLGGTNAHLIVEEAPVVVSEPSFRQQNLLLWSAKTTTALQVVIEQSRQALLKDPHLSFGDLAYTLQIGRARHEQRAFLVCSGLQDAQQKMKDGMQYRRRKEKHQKVCFLFPGLGDLSPGMTEQLYTNEPVFRHHLDICADYLIPLLHQDIRQVLYKKSEETKIAARFGRRQKEEQTSVNCLEQPALFAIEYALARTWQHLIGSPEAMLGYSLGEYVAACLGGVLSLEDALTLVTKRAQLLQTLPASRLIAVTLNEKSVQSLLGKEVFLAASNGPQQCILGGTVAAIEALQQQCKDQDIVTMDVGVSHAFHTPLMKAIVPAFTDVFQQVHLRVPQIPYISNVTGTWITEKEACDPHYWIQHLCQTVRLADGLDVLLEEASRVFLETGPGQALRSLLLAQGGEQLSFGTLPSLYHSASEQEAFLDTLGNLWMAGVEIDWPHFYHGELRHRLQLPTYPFERQKYWAASQQPEQTLPVQNFSTLTSEKEEEGQARSVQTELEQTILHIFRYVLGKEHIDITENFFEVGGNSLNATQVMARLRTTFDMDLPLQTIFQAPTAQSLAQVLEEKLLDLLEEFDEDLEGAKNNVHE